MELLNCWFIFQDICENPAWATKLNLTSFSCKLISFIIGRFVIVVCDIGYKEGISYVCLCSLFSLFHWLHFNFPEEETLFEIIIDHEEHFQAIQFFDNWFSFYYLKKILSFFFVVFVFFLFLFFAFCFLFFGLCYETRFLVNVYKENAEYGDFILVIIVVWLSYPLIIYWNLRK